MYRGRNLISSWRIPDVFFFFSYFMLFQELYSYIYGGRSLTDLWISHVFLFFSSSPLIFHIIPGSLQLHYMKGEIYKDYEYKFSSFSSLLVFHIIPGTLQLHIWRNKFTRFISNTTHSCAFCLTLHTLTQSTKHNW